MRLSPLLFASALGTLGLGSSLFAGVGVTPPVDTYFSLGVAENAHTHVGAERLYLDFVSTPSAGNASVGIVTSVPVSPTAITLDGSAADWNASYFSTITLLPQSNLPLSYGVDATSIPIELGSAYDDTYVYFVARWEDAGHTASLQDQKWIFGDQGGGETGWNPKKNVGVTAGAPNAGAVNATHVFGHPEDEDHLIFMFPIVDEEITFSPDGNFSATGPGCAAYCHGNLADSYPWTNYTGEGYSVMQANVAGDKADVWLWESLESDPSGYAGDEYMTTAGLYESGRLPDAGFFPWIENVATGSNPTSMHSSGLGYAGDVLMLADAVPYAGVPSPGDQVPFFITQAPTLSQADVRSEANYNSVTHQWTVELRRLRDTGNSDDRNFNSGITNPPPTAPLITGGNAANGSVLYAGTCELCHQAGGVGLPVAQNWTWTRVQRASASQIRRLLVIEPWMQGFQGLFTDQELEDIAAYLQTQATFSPSYTLTVSVNGPSEPGVVTASHGDISCPGVCSAELLEGTPVTVSAREIPGWMFSGWTGGPCGTANDCQVTIASDVTLTANYDADCNGNGVPDNLDILGGLSLDVAPTDGVPDECGNGFLFCFGDGAQGSCPCGNNSAVGAHEGCLNNRGFGCWIQPSGTASVSNDQLTLTVHQASVNDFGIFVQNVSTGNRVPFYNGVLCLSLNGQLVRHYAPPAVLPTVCDANGSGTNAQAMTVGDFLNNTQPGVTMYYQFWYRDNNNTLCTNGANFSAGVGLTWLP